MDRFQRNGEVQRSFCDIAAHEMKTPLTILQGNLDVALMKARTTEEYREALINNLEQVGRLIALTRSLLTLATFTSGKPPLHLVPLSLGPKIQDLVNELTLLADDRRITLSFESIDPTSPRGCTVAHASADQSTRQRASLHAVWWSRHCALAGGWRRGGCGCRGYGPWNRAGTSPASVRAVLSDRLGTGEGCWWRRTWAGHHQRNRGGPWRNSFGHKPS